MFIRQRELFSNQIISANNPLKSNLQAKCRRVDVGRSICYSLQSLQRYFAKQKPALAERKLQQLDELVLWYKEQEFWKGVYIIHSDCGLTKIGRCSDLFQRFTQIHQSTPRAVRILSFFPTKVDQAEKMLHWHFEKHKIKGEWFDLSFAKQKQWLRYELTRALEQQNSMYKYLDPAAVHDQFWM